ncbi:MAG TPA: hypothetical protein ACFYD5_04115 [Candidatus Tripitaka sp. YC43]
MMAKQCKQLISKAEGQGELNRIEQDSELWEFLKFWIIRTRKVDETNVVEKFIYHWISFNAWASQAVPDLARNHEDAYLIHSTAKAPEFQERFSRLFSTCYDFKKNVNEFVDLAPVFQVLWLKNNDINSWDEGRESRKNFIKRVRERGPYIRVRNKDKPAFAPGCALDHLDKREPVPADWPHVLHMIYKVRCNLFHGGKEYDSSRDRKFIELADSILWAIWKQEIPHGYIPG